ncbi:MAG: 50S ribosomal protein L11 methyltransferase [Lachnospiraceae bacterium]|nr:50S ribosomal protein L11 methyltransferase [Lachnospiraceae bacterium]
MEWNKYTIHTTEEAEDMVSGMLAELGFEGIEIEDKRPMTAEESGGMFGDVVPDFGPDDHLADISFYADKDEDSSEIIRKVEEALEELRSFMEIGEGTISLSETAEEEWINNWKEYFHSFRIDDILIEPTWEKGSAQEKDAAMVLHIDPGTAFGTGAHESTQLAIRSLRKYLKEGDRFLDVGTGSGILGIVALKSGASHVFGTDLDENTLPAISDNLLENDIREEDFERVLGNIADDPATQEKAGFGIYDVACANIIAEILTEITPQIPAHLKKGGYYITSGILQEKEHLVIDAAEKAGMQVVEIMHQGEWSGITFRN